MQNESLSTSQAQPGESAAALASPADTLSDAARAVFAAWGASQVKLGLATYAEHRKFRTLRLNRLLSDAFLLQPADGGCRLKFPGRTDEWMGVLPWAHALADSASGGIYLFMREANGAVAVLGLSCRPTLIAKLRETHEAARPVAPDFKMYIGENPLSIEFRGTSKEVAL